MRIPGLGKVRLEPYFTTNNTALLINKGYYVSGLFIAVIIMYGEHILIRINTVSYEL